MNVNELKEQIDEIDKTIAILVKARRTLLVKQSMEDCISRKQLYDLMTDPLIPKPPIVLKE